MNSLTGDAVMSIGLPGSGKTTFFKPLAEKEGYVYLAVDEIRRRFGVKPGQDTPEAVWEHIRRETEAALRSGSKVFIEAVFTGTRRQAFLSFLRECGARTISGILVNTPPELAWQRNLGRAEQTPRSVFDQRLQEHMENPPRLEDGFDTFIILDENGQQTSVAEMSAYAKVV